MVYTLTVCCLRTTKSMLTRVNMFFCIEEKYKRHVLSVVATMDRCGLASAEKNVQLFALGFLRSHGPSSDAKMTSSQVSRVCIPGYVRQLLRSGMEQSKSITQRLMGSSTHLRREYFGECMDLCGARQRRLHTVSSNRISDSQGYFFPHEKLELFS